MKKIFIKIKNFFNYQATLVKYAVAKYEIVRLKDENDRKDKEIDEWKIAYENSENRCKKFKGAYRIATNERDDIKQQCKKLEGEIKKIKKGSEKI